MSLLPFRLRGREVSRLEAFSDAVFGFAATLLVVSLDVPRSYDALIASLRGFIPFSACFALLIWIWWIHNGFFRRYGMQDAGTTTLNSVLLFVVLFFVYPMRIVLTTFIERIMWGAGLITAADFTFSINNDMSHVAHLFAIYGVGFCAIFACFAILYHRAVKNADKLELDEEELFDAKSRRTEMLSYAFVGALGAFFGMTGIGARIAVGGWIYCFLGPIGAYIGVKRGRHLEALRAAATRLSPAEPS